MTGLPRITIVTPSYNQGGYIEETIRSVLDQGYGNLEYVIVDGGSTDESVGIIQRYAQHLAWWVSEKDRGQSHAINKGFARATGDLYAFINSDDTLKPGCLAAVAEAWNAGGGGIWVVGGVHCFGGSINATKWLREECRASDWWGKNIVPQQGSFWPAAAWRRLGGLREDLRYVFDYEYWMRLRFRAGLRPVGLHRVLAGFRFHAVSKTVAEGGGFFPELARVRREYRPLLPVRERLRSRMMERRVDAGAARGQALALAKAGRRGSALKKWCGSIGRWPPSICTRRSLGALRRVMSGRGAGSCTGEC